MIRIRGFARKTRRLTKGGSMSAATRDAFAQDSSPVGNLDPGVKMGNNGHNNGNATHTETFPRNGTSESVPAVRAHGPHGSNGTNGSNGSNGHHGSNGHVDGLTEYLHEVVEHLVEPRSPIEGRAPLDRNGDHAAVDGQSAPKLETIFARAAIDADDAKPIPHWKRLFDVFCILLTLPIWLPLLLLVMAWIKMVSPGPIFYRQQRVGYRGRLFMIFKFRTMHVNAETRSHEQYFAHLMATDTPMTKLDALEDTRLIRCGRLLRATGLDELPQLFNVFRGDMSLVGPRPCLSNEYELYSPAQKQRVKAPPGLTGYWQVNGKNKTTFSEMIAMDIYYAEHMSVWLDLAIIFKTIPALAAETLESRARRNGIMSADPVSVRR